MQRSVSFYVNTSFFPWRTETQSTETHASLAMTKWIKELFLRSWDFVYVWLSLEQTDSVVMRRWSRAGDFESENILMVTFEHWVIHCSTVFWCGYASRLLEIFCKILIAPSSSWIIEGLSVMTSMNLSSLPKTISLYDAWTFTH